MILRLKEIRENRDVSQSDLARLVSVNQTAVSQWERGVSLPSCDKLPLLAAVLDCSIDDLFTDDARSNPIIPA